MEDLLRQKFSQPDFRCALLNTKTEELVEKNYWRDFFWGICKGRGENHLGKLLMKIRNDMGNFVNKEKTKNTKVRDVGLFDES